MRIRIRIQQLKLMRIRNPAGMYKSSAGTVLYLLARNAEEVLPPGGGCEQLRLVGKWQRLAHRRGEGVGRRAAQAEGRLAALEEAVPPPTQRCRRP